MVAIDAQLLGTWVKGRRNAKGFTQAELAQKAGISRFQVIRIENGETTTRRGTIAALAAALDAPEGDAMRLAGFAGEASPAAEIGAQIADIVERLEPADQRALCAHLRDVARSWISSISGKTPVNRVLTTESAWLNFRLNGYNTSGMNL